MKAIIKPSGAEGLTEAPPSKSMAHRYILCAALARGTSKIENIAYSEDILATLDCVKALGALVEERKDHVLITGGNILNKGNWRFDCRECGTTLRFFIPIAMLRDAGATFFGSPTLMQRPMTVYEELAKKQGIAYEKIPDGIKVGGGLTAGTYEIRGNISSQFVSGLIFALSNLREDSIIKLIPPVESRSYIELTLETLKRFKVEVDWSAENALYIRGGQEYTATDIAIEGDFSNAAFFEALNAMGGRVTVKGLNMSSSQGDRVYLDYFSKLTEGRVTLDISDCPDLGPILFAVAAANHGGSFKGTDRLSIKESDRGRAMREELLKFGINTDMEDNVIHIKPGKLKPPKDTLKGHNDHRIVMALSALLSITGGSITGAEAVKKSFPDYFEKLRALGVKVELV